MSILEPTRIRNFVGGGGGSTLRWKGDAPLVEVFNTLCFLFVKDGTNKITADLQIPTSRSTSKQGLVKIKAFTPSTTNGFLLRATTYLVNQGVALDDVNYSYLSTNVITVNGSPAYKTQQLVFDITDANGLVAGQVVNAGATLRIELTRLTDTDTADIYLAQEILEVII